MLVIRPFQHLRQRDPVVVERQGFGVRPALVRPGVEFLLLPGCLAGQGLSPHRRGNPNRSTERPVRRGSIPAQAGEPRAWRGWNAPRWVYPRTGGGTEENLHTMNVSKGLSPHRRGNLDLRGGASRTPAVYPRTGGGTGALPGPRGSRQGLSPHRRGNRREHIAPATYPGSIPAQVLYVRLFRQKCPTFRRCEMIGKAD